jgi:aryl carrier-like protein
MGRRPPTFDAERELDRLRGRGASVAAMSGDVSRADDVRSVLGRIARDMPPLRGVVHSAGVLADAVLTQQDEERFARVMGPKADGARHLDEQTRSLPLDFFVLFSSTSALLGPAGQANHAAANAYLDALAHRRRAEGLPALSVNWGAWAKIGAAAARQADERVGRHGFGSIDPESGLDVFAHLLLSDAVQVAVLPAQWAVVRRDSVGRPTPAILSDLLASSAASTEPAPAAVAAPLLDRLTAAPAGEKLSVLDAHLRDEIRHVLGRDAAAPLDPGQGLTDLGLDSLMAVELRNRLGRAVGRPLPATLLFDYPTLDRLRTFLAAEVLKLPEEAPPGSPVDTPTTGDDLEGLSEAELGALLDAELAAVRGRIGSNESWEGGS